MTATLTTALALAPMQTAQAAEDVLPDAVSAMMKARGIDAANVGVVVARLDDRDGRDDGALGGARIVAHQADVLFNPASVAKLITAMAALDILDASHTWTTTFAADGAARDGALDGDLYFIGGGDPYITVDRFLKMLSDLRDKGIEKIGGRLVIDDSVFELPPHDAAAFDGAATKPYNVGASGAALNFKTQRVVFRADDNAVRVFADPPNDNFVIVNDVAVAAGSCRNWRGRIRERLSGDENRMTLQVGGRYAARCGEQSFYISSLSHAAYIAGVFGALWRRMGGEWRGEWATGAAPAGAVVVGEFESHGLLNDLWAMNKYSNNVIARHLLIRLSGGAAPYSYARGRAALDGWLRARGVETAVVENGSGLSRMGRVSAGDLAGLLAGFWRHPYRAELVASLPITGVDGTMRRRLADGGLARSGHFKTGSLADVKSIGGYMRDAAGRWVVVVALVKNEAEAKAFQDDLIKWVYHLD